MTRFILALLLATTSVTCNLYADPEPTPIEEEEEEEEDHEEEE